MLTPRIKPGSNPKDLLRRGPRHRQLAPIPRGAHRAEAAGCPGPDAGASVASRVSRVLGMRGLEGGSGGALEGVRDGGLGLRAAFWLKVGPKP